MEHGWLEWVAFLGFVAAMLALDLGIFHRKDHVVKPREALAWTGIWVALAFAFAGLVWRVYGADKALQFVTGYVIEESLSVDNMFVFVVLFGALGIPAALQHRVLFWGILSALVMRGAMIAGGTALVTRFHAVMYFFGVFLVVTGVRLLVSRSESRPDESRVLAWLRKVIPSTSRFDGHRFLTREGGRLVATPLLFALVSIEITDVVFAVDSIPAVFAVTQDPFIVFTSNIFAILGLRSLYFALAGLVARFRYLKPSLAGVLMFVGVKMTIADFVQIPAGVSLAVVCAILGAGIAASAWRGKADATRAATAPPHRAAERV